MSHFFAEMPLEQVAFVWAVVVLFDKLTFNQGVLSSSGWYLAGVGGGYLYNFVKEQRAKVANERVDLANFGQNVILPKNNICTCEFVKGTLFDS